MVNIYKLELTLLQQEMLRFLIIRSGKSYNILGIAKALNRTQAGIAKAVPGLEKKELIKTRKDRESGRWSIELNLDKKEVIESKRIENLKILYESSLVRYLEDNFPGRCVILFGSYSRGEDLYYNEANEYGSDIDIAIIGSGKKEINLDKFEKILEREIIINFYPSFNDIHKNLKNNILNGIILSGSIDL